MILLAFVDRFELQFIRVGNLVIHILPLRRLASADQEFLDSGEARELEIGGLVAIAVFIERVADDGCVK